MPQIDIFIIKNEIFWLVLSIISIYYYFVCFIIPNIIVGITLRKKILYNFKLILHIFYKFYYYYYEQKIKKLLKKIWIDNFVFLITFLY